MLVGVQIFVLCYYIAHYHFQVLHTSFNYGTEVIGVRTQSSVIDSFVLSTSD